MSSHQTEGGGFFSGIHSVYSGALGLVGEAKPHASMLLLGFAILMLLIGIIILSSSSKRTPGFLFTGLGLLLGFGYWTQSMRYSRPKTDKTAIDAAVAAAIAAKSTVKLDASGETNA